MSESSPDAATAISHTQQWMQKAVIGLNLCPFAKPVVTKNLVRYVHESTTSEDTLLALLSTELKYLDATPITEVETTLIIHPEILKDFLKYNDFLGLADKMLVDLKFAGIIQIASFHPRYQFQGTDVDDISNYTNRSPYPTLHLLREESVTQAVESAVDVDAIPERNIGTLNQLGIQGWKALGIPSGDKS